MNRIPLNSLVVSSDVVKTRLKGYIDKISTYRNFNSKMFLYVYSYGDKNDFVAFESKDYNISFLSSDYKPSYFFLPQLHRTDTNYLDFKSFLEKA